MEKITKKNFLIETSGVWEVCKKPTREPDFINDSDSDNGSRYWYLKKEVIRESDYWSNDCKNIASCYWYLKGNIKKFSTGKISFKELERQTPIIDEKLKPRGLYNKHYCLNLCVEEMDWLKYKSRAKKKQKEYEYYMRVPESLRLKHRKIADILIKKKYKINLETHCIRSWRSFFSKKSYNPITMYNYLKEMEKKNFKDVQIAEVVSGVKTKELEWRAYAI